MTRRGDARLRLLSLHERTALTAERMAGQRGRFAALASRHEDGTAPQAVAAFNLFPTPAALARRLVDLAGIEAGQRVLEPSAGTGRLLDALPAGCAVTAVELVPALQGHLFNTYPAARLIAGDFLQRTVEDLGGPFDRVVMNPPFHRGADVAHILHARAMLAPGGCLVSLCYAGTAQARHLQPLAETWEELPAGSFACEGTRADVILLTLRAAAATSSAGGAA